MYLVCDIGGTNIKSATISEKGVLNNIEISTVPDTYNELLFYILKLQKKYPAIKGISLSCPGIYDPTKEIVTGSSALTYIIDKEFVKDLKKISKIENIKIENDGNCALLGEKWKGGAQECSSAVIFVIGSAVGGGVLYQDKICRGHDLNAGEIGYMLIDNNPKKNKFHSLGGKIGMHALVKDARKIDANIKNGRDLFRKIEKGNELELLVRERIAYLVVAIVNIQYLINPEIIIIGGGVSNSLILKKIFYEELDSLYLNRPFYTSRPNVTFSELGDHANLIGAGYKIINE